MGGNGCCGGKCIRERGKVGSMLVTSDYITVKTQPLILYQALYFLCTPASSIIPNTTYIRLAALGCCMATSSVYHLIARGLIAAPVESWRLQHPHN